MAKPTLDDIDRRMPVTFSAWKQDAGKLITSHAVGTQPVQFEGAAAAAFMALASASVWRSQIEADLQCLASDRDGRPLLSSFMPLAAFSARLRTFEPGDENAELEGVFSRLRAVADAWACVSADLVCFEGYVARARPLGAEAACQTVEPLTKAGAEAAHGL